MEQPIEKIQIKKKKYLLSIISSTVVGIPFGYYLVMMILGEIQLASHWILVVIQFLITAMIIYLLYLYVLLVSDFFKFDSFIEFYQTHLKFKNPGKPQFLSIKYSDIQELIEVPLPRSASGLGIVTKIDYGNKISRFMRWKNQWRSEIKYVSVIHNGLNKITNADLMIKILEKVKHAD